MDISNYDLETRRKVYEMLGEYGNDVEKLYNDLEDLREIQQRLGRVEFYRDEITIDEIELLYDLEHLDELETEIEKLIEK